MAGRNSDTPGVYEILEAFIRLRESGMNRDEAWLHIVKTYPLSENTRQILLRLAKAWERREGHHYRHRYLTYPPKDDSRQPSDRTDEGVPQRPDPLMTQPIEPIRMSILEQIRQAAAATKSNAESTGPTIPQSPTYFGPRSALLLYFEAKPNPLRVTFTSEKEMIIGRSTPNTAMDPDIDLTKVASREYGVSRMHAAIACQNNQLLLTDLGSINHTLVNGAVLRPNQPCVLKDGDHLWFGELHCRIQFQHL